MALPNDESLAEAAAEASADRRQPTGVSAGTWSLIFAELLCWVSTAYTQPTRD